MERKLHYFMNLDLCPNPYRCLQVGKLFIGWQIARDYWREKTRWGIYSTELLSLTRKSDIEGFSLVRLTLFKLAFDFMWFPTYKMKYEKRFQTEAYSSSLTSLILSNKQVDEINCWISALKGYRVWLEHQDETEHYFSGKDAREFQQLLEEILKRKN